MKAMEYGHEADLLVFGQRVPGMHLNEPRPIHRCYIDCLYLRPHPAILCRRSLGLISERFCFVLAALKAVQRAPALEGSYAG